MRATQLPKEPFLGIPLDKRAEVLIHHLIPVFRRGIAIEIVIKMKGLPHALDNPTPQEQLIPKEALHAACVFLRQLLNLIVDVLYLLRIDDTPIPDILEIPDNPLRLRIIRRRLIDLPNFLSKKQEPRSPEHRLVIDIHPVCMQAIFFI